jgi:hypothetical protein
MTDTANTATLSMPIPTGAAERLTLFCIRRMGAHGIRDAHAANLMLNRFGLPFRRPLVLLRAFMVELARASRRQITIAPCCATRMTLDEARVLAALRTSAGSEHRASRHLGRLTESGQTAGSLCAAAAYNLALADLGYPLTLRETSPV